MSRQDDIKRLIFNHTRLLQKLKEQQALAGMSVDPKILLEIEDIEAKIERLQAELKEIESEGEPASGPDAASLIDIYQEPDRIENHPVNRVGGDHIQITIGDQAHNIAAGKNVRQSIGEPGPAQITEADMATIRALFLELKRQVNTQAPSEKKISAMERIEELEEAVTAERPDLTTMAYVKKWFGKHLPQLTGAVVNLLLHPVVGKVVETAAGLPSGDLKRQFGPE